MPSSSARRNRRRHSSSSSSSSSSSTTSSSSSYSTVGRRRKRVSKRSRRDPIDRLTRVMTTFISQSNERPSTSAPRIDAIPYFDPSNSNQTAENWCRKIEELKDMPKWSEDVTTQIALSKLRGLAEKWYNGLSSVKFTWEQFKEKLTSTFKPRRDFYDALQDIARRRKRSEEGYADYYFDMMALLNTNGVTGANAVSCLIGGIGNEIVKAGAKAGRHQTPESLYEYLCTCSDRSQPIQASSFKRRDKQRHNYDHRQRKYIFQDKPEPRDVKPYKERTNLKELAQIKCFRCGLTGHFANKCQEKVSERCKLCKSKGHHENRCPSKTASTKNVS